MNISIYTNNKYHLQITIKNNSLYMNSLDTENLEDSKQVIELNEEIANEIEKFFNINIQDYNVSISTSETIYVDNI